ncbi:hypothetical protein [Oceanivirga salmonicida]|nr:hypothetical protein [Oceanivirga salmonicida]
MTHFNSVLLKDTIKVGMIHIDYIDYKKFRIRNYYTFESNLSYIDSSITNELAIPVYVIFGADYKNLTLNLEIGGKYLYRQRGDYEHNLQFYIGDRYSNHFAFGLGLSAGYKF